MASEQPLVGPLIPIGRFSKISRLSVSSLRYYDELGLLRPAYVDPASSYRYYLLSQVRTAETIRLLRALDMPLEDVQRLIAEGQSAAAQDLLNRHERRMEERIAEGQRILAYLRRLQGGEGEETLSPVRAHTYPPQDILALHARVPETAVPGAWRELAAELRDHLRRCPPAPAQPVGAIFPDPFHDERAVSMVVFTPAPPRAPGGGRIVREHLPGGLCAVVRHAGPYTLLHRPYEQLAAWMQAHGHETAGAPREVYVVGPTETTDPNSYETDVIWPIR
ncbi:MAG: MerR family transcriptional regulator [Thermomicrobiales bacterium]|nr:MerR family transcriptional regulator [Thermomicrobiales bacterium]